MTPSPPLLHPRVTPARVPLKAICFHCGSDRVAVADTDGRLNKACPGCGGAQLVWIARSSSSRSPAHAPQP